MARTLFRKGCYSWRTHNVLQGIGAVAYVGDCCTSVSMGDLRRWPSEGAPDSPWFLSWFLDTLCDAGKQMQPRPTRVSIARWATTLHCCLRSGRLWQFRQQNGWRGVDAIS